MKLIEPYLIRLVSPARPTNAIGRLSTDAILGMAKGKPETVVHAEVLGIRERYAFEPLHFHTIEQSTCQVCSKAGRMVWTDSIETFQRDTNRCGDLPVVEVSLDD